MIDVPVEVKDALREGSYTKNYRFKVLEEPEKPAGYYEIARLAEAEKFTMPVSTGYKIIGEAPSSYTGITTWEDDEPMEWLTPSTTSPYTEFSGYFTAGDVISVSGLSNIVRVSVQQFYPQREGKEEIDIDNNNLVSESVNIDERMCSGDTLKFGLCEGSSLEFQYFDHPNITGRRVQVFVDVEYEKPVTQYAWETQGIFSDYYDIIGMSGECRVFNPEPNAWEFMWVYEDGQSARVYAESSEDGTVVPLGDVTGRTFLVSKPMIPEHHLGYVQLLVPHEVPTIFTHTIPMGFFDVKKCSRQASTGIIKATCYNKLQSEYLDAKANSLLEDAFTESDRVMLVDIQDLLLNEYQIQKKLWPMEADDSSIGGTTISLDGIPMYFTELYGIETPLSAYMYDKKMDVSLTSPLYLFFLNGRVTYDSTSADDTWTIYQNFGKLSIFEAHVVERLKEIIDGAQLRTTSTISPFTGGMVTGDMLVDFLCKNNVFQELCGIEVNRNGVREKYSTVQYKYEERKGIAHTVAGTIDDFFLTMKEGAAIVYINYPYRLDGLFLPFTAGTEPLFAEIPYGQLTDDNRYWLDSDRRSSAPVRIYPIKYENGDDFEAYDPVGGDYTCNITEALTCGVVDLTDAEKIKVTVGDLPEFTLRDITSAIYETSCQFGQLDRQTDLFSGVELNYSRLYPADTLYPSDSLYPTGAALSGFKSMYSKLWADEGNIHKWRYLIITYKGLNENQQEEDYTLQRTVNADGTDDYNMSDNWLFRNLIWTAEQVGEYADAMVAKMQDITWFPFEMWCAGLPYLETGDEIEIPLNGESYTSYVLQRQLKGIQNLQDTYINGTLDIF